MSQPAVRTLRNELIRLHAGRELGVQQLERDRAIVLEIAGEVDRGYAAPQLALDRVAPFESGLQTGEHLIHDVPVIEGSLAVCGAGRQSATARRSSGPRRIADKPNESG